MKVHNLHSKESRELGVALLTALLLLMLMSAMTVGLFYKLHSEQHMQRTDSGSTMAYYGAEAGMEKMMADLNLLFAQQAAPNWCAITALENLQPSLSDVGVNYAAYRITVPNPPTGCGGPPSTVRSISQGPNEGLTAQIVPLTLEVTADRPSGEEVRMIRQVEVAEIPVFQFGVFSETDLSYHPGADFLFAGRVHTNGNLFLASSADLTFTNKIRAAGDVIRDRMINGDSTSAQGRTGPVWVPTAPTGCDGAQPACRNLRLSPNEGSSTGGPTPPYGGTGTANGGWISLSTSTYAGMILSGTTGAKRLSMAFVQGGVNPIEIIRRPAAGESPLSALGQSRHYNLSQIRVLLSDNPAELPGGAGDGQNIRLANVANAGSGPDYSNGVPVAGTLDGDRTGANNPIAGNTYFAEAKTGAVANETGWTSVPNLPGAYQYMPDTFAPKTCQTCTSWNLLDGYLRVEIRRNDGTYIPVTREWLELGFARGLNTPSFTVTNSVHPNAILILQQQAERDGDGVLEAAEMVNQSPGTTNQVTGTMTRNNWYPINMFDTREGTQRGSNSDVSATTNCEVNGVVNVVEIDVKNLRRWLRGQIGANGTQTEYLSQNGYVLFFSDRRGMRPNPSGVKAGEYGFEDVINPASSTGTPNGLLDAGEDVNSNNTVETYGAANLGYGFGGTTGSITATVSCPGTARKNWVSGARHVVRLVNGTLGNVPTRLDNDLGGFTLASENPAYILGDYNARAGFGNPHASSAVIADTVTLISNGWMDRFSFASPENAANRDATETYYRVAIATGKPRAFPKGSSSDNEWGLDGGVHNFLRYLEDWHGSTISHYQGSMVSLYYSMYGTGIYKCCQVVYNPPVRQYAFDLDFQDVNKMPPGTPTFRDVVNLGFQRVF